MRTTNKKPQQKVRDEERKAQAARKGRAATMLSNKAWSDETSARVFPQYAKRLERLREVAALARGEAPAKSLAIREKAAQSARRGAKPKAKAKATKAVEVETKYDVDEEIEAYFEYLDVLLEAGEGSPVLTDELATIAAAFDSRESGDDVWDALETIQDSDEASQDMRDAASNALKIALRLNEEDALKSASAALTTKSDGCCVTIQFIEDDSDADTQEADLEEFASEFTSFVGVTNTGDDNYEYEVEFDDADDADAFLEAIEQGDLLGHGVEYVGLAAKASATPIAKEFDAEEWNEVLEGLLDAIDANRESADEPNLWSDERDAVEAALSMEEGSDELHDALDSLAAADDADIKDWARQAQSISEQYSDKAAAIVTKEIDSADFVERLQGVLEGFATILDRCDDDETDIINSAKDSVEQAMNEVESGNWDVCAAYLNDAAEYLDRVDGVDSTISALDAFRDEANDAFRDEANENASGEKSAGHTLATKASMNDVEELLGSAASSVGEACEYLSEKIEKVSDDDNYDQDMVDNMNEMLDDFAEFQKRIGNTDADDEDGINELIADFENLPYDEEFVPRDAKGAMSDCLASLDQAVQTLVNMDEDD